MNKKSRPKGSTTVLFALFTSLFLAFAALAVDVGHWYVVKNEIQNAADAAAYSGAGKLFTATTGPNWGEAQTQATAAISYNRVNQKVLSAADGAPPSTGYWSFNSRYSESTGELLQTPITDIDAPAVRVSLKTTVSTWFAKLIGIKEVDIAAKATAGVAAPGYLGPSAMFPLVMSKCVYDNYWINTADYRGPKLDANGVPLIFRIGPDYPISPCTSSGVWTTYLLDLSSTEAVRKLVDNGNPTALAIGDKIWIQPGVKNTLYQAINSCSLAGNKKCADATIAVVPDVTQKAMMPILAFACLRILHADNGNQPFVEVQMTTQCRPNDSGGTGPFYGALSPPKLFN